MMLSYLLSLCLCVSLFHHSQAGALYHTAPGNPFYDLPISTTMPGVRVIDITVPYHEPMRYIALVVLGQNETVEMNPSYCTGCYLILEGCQRQFEGDTCVYNPNTTYTNTVQSEPCVYFWYVMIPSQKSIYYTVIHHKWINDEWIPSLLFVRMHNVWPVSSSSTGPAVTWPLGRVTGLYIEDGVSSAFLPHNLDGWDWIEYDRDLSNYTFEVGFVTHLMTYDAFYIEPTFEDAIHVSTKLNDTIASSNYLGTSSNPITDEYTIYRYHFNIPIGGTSEIRLHYLYQMPGESNLNELLFVVRITNAYGLPPNSLIQRTSMSSRQPEVELSLDQSTQQSSQSSTDQDIYHIPDYIPEDMKKTIKSVQDKLLTLSMELDHPMIEVSSSGINGASSASISALAVAVCALMATFML